MDWQRVRSELAQLRREQQPKMTQTRLGEKASIAKSTVNRIENVYGEPDHVPDLDTIERWVLATGLTLSSFFARIESGQGGHETGKAATTGGTARDRAVSAAADETADADRAVGRAIAQIVQRELARGQTTDPRPRSAGGRKTHRKDR